MSAPRDNSCYKIDNNNIKNFKVSKSSSIHIISPGPSIRNFDWKTLKSKDIMTVNDSLFHLPIKVSYHIYNEPPVRDIEINNYNKASNFNKIQKFTTFNITGWHQLNLYSGKNLAFILAINVAIDLGYKSAYLYGYDFSCDGGYIHWWDKEEVSIDIINKKVKLLEIQKSIFKKYEKNISKKIKLIHITE